MMDCKKLRELLDAYIDRELSPDAAAQAEAHIVECDACRRAVEVLARLRDGVRATAGKPEAPAHLIDRVRRSLSPNWRPVWALPAAAAVVLLAGVLSLLFPSVGGAEASALDHIALTLDASRHVVLEGKLLCRDCELEKQYGYHAMCPLTGHHGAIVTSDGRIWNILEGTKSAELIHNSSLLGKRVRVEGVLYRKAGSLAISDYQLL